MGDRAHIAADRPIGLSVHVEDVVAVVLFEDLCDVVLCAASYGGMPVTGAVDRVSDRLSAVVYVDALVPFDGQSALDLLPVNFGEAVREGVKAHGDQWRVPMPSDLFDALLPVGSLPKDEWTGYRRRLRDHPAASLTEPVHLTGAGDHVPRAFVRCTTGEFPEDLGGDPIEACAAHARAEGWLYRELATRHDPHVFDPEGITGVLDEIARAY